MQQRIGIKETPNVYKQRKKTLKRIYWFLKFIFKKTNKTNPKKVKNRYSAEKLTKEKANTIRVSTKTISHFKIQSNTDKFMTDFDKS